MAKFEITEEMLNEGRDPNVAADPYNYPVTAEEFLKSPWAKNDKGFLLSKFSQDGDNVEVVVDKDMPFALNDEKQRFETWKNRGVLLPSRTDIMKGTIHPLTKETLSGHNFDEMYTIAIAVAVVDKTGTKVGITDNSHFKPGSEDNTNYAIAGLVTSGLFEAFRDEAVEEFAAVADAGDHVRAFYLTVPDELPGSAEADAAHHQELQASKEEVMRHQLVLQGHEDLAAKEWRWERLPSTSVGLPGMQSVKVDIIGNVTELKAAATPDKGKHSLNFVLGAQADLPDNAKMLVSEFMNDKDNPEQFNEIRNSQMASFDQLALTHIQAPKADAVNGVKSALPALKSLIVAVTKPNLTQELSAGGQSITQSASAPTQPKLQQPKP